MDTKKTPDTAADADVAPLGASYPAEHASNDSWFERLKLACNATTDTALGIALGITQASVAKAKKKGRVPSDWIIAISYKYGVSADWLLYGTGPMVDPNRGSQEPARAGVMRAGEPLQKVVPIMTASKEDGCTIEHENGDILMVPMVDARLSAGTGSFETGDHAERYYAFRLDFLIRKGIPSQMVLMRVAGDSMEPEIKDGDVVLIDQNQKTPIPGKLYAVGVEDMVYIKEVNAEPGKLVLSSYNKTYPALEVDARGDLVDGIRIIGRAVWVGRELK